MPFAAKFRAMMDLPLPGDTLDQFEVESVAVRDEGSDWRGYRYSVEMVLSGPGGKSGVKEAVAPLLARRVTTFSSYGNPYALWFGRPEIENIGNRRYSVSVPGAGARIDLEKDLTSFVHHLQDEGRLATGSAAPSVITAFLEAYRDDVRRKVDRYRRTLRTVDRAAE